MSVASFSVVFTFSLWSSCTIKWVHPSVPTHHTGKTLVCSGNANVGVDLDQLILGCVNIYLCTYITCLQPTCMWPALFRGLSSNASKLWRSGQFDNSYLMAYIRSGIYWVQIHFLVEWLVIIRIEQSETLFITTVGVKANFLCFHRL